MMRLHWKTLARFWSRVDKTETCWLYTAGTPHPRDGHVHFGSKETGVVFVHRLSWTLAYGPIPKGKCVLHSCDVPNCVRPSHLFLGTRGDNNRDRALKGRNRYAWRTLTATDAVRIKHLHSKGKSQASLARKFKVSATSIWQIVSGRSYKYAH